MYIYTVKYCNNVQNVNILQQMSTRRVNIYTNTFLKSLTNTFLFYKINFVSLLVLIYQTFT